MHLTNNWELLYSCAPHFHFQVLPHRLTAGILQFFRMIALLMFCSTWPQLTLMSSFQTFQQIKKSQQHSKSNLLFLGMIFSVVPI